MKKEKARAVRKRGRGPSHGAHCRTGRLPVRVAGATGLTMRTGWGSTVIALALVAAASPAFATWSIVAADQDSGRVVVASATCADITASFLYHLQAVIVPGKGAAACQAWVDVTHQDQALIERELARGTEPRTLIGMLKDAPAFPSRQFGIVDLEGRSAGVTGERNPAAAGDVQGRVPGTRIVYSIQGNTLRSSDVIAAAVQAFVATNGSLADRGMAALEAGDAAGGDARCGCPPGLTVDCDDRTSSLAYIAMAERDAAPGELALFIPVSQAVLAEPGAEWIDVAEGDSFNPVKTLRLRYDRWRAAHANDRR